METDQLNPNACPDQALALASGLVEVLEAARETPWSKEAKAVASWGPDALQTLRRAARLLNQAEELLSWKQEEERRVRRVLGQEP